jgi:glutamate synthase (NADPH/NADH) small chain
MDKNKTPMPEQEPMIRNRNFQEVALGYAEEQVKAEAARCLGCKNQPCVGGCPVNVRIPEFIKKLAEGDPAGAYDILTSTNSLPAVFGRVCPQETQCEARCVRGVEGDRRHRSLDGTRRSAHGDETAKRPSPSKKR